MSDLPSFQTLYDAGKAEAIARSQAIGQPLSDFSDGSGVDLDLGIAGAMGEELTQKIVSDTRKVFLDTANGADLDAYLYDRYRYTRQAATKAAVVLTFSRPAPGAGNAPAGVIPAGTTVLTDVDVDGNVYSFNTDTALALALNVLGGQVTATCSSAGRNSVGAGALKNLMGSLFDSTLRVTNAAPAAGGNDAESYEAFRARGRKGAAKTGSADAIVAGVLTDVPAVRKATLVELAGGATFYVGDSFGNSNQPLVDSVVAILGKYRSGGVNVFVAQTIAQSVACEVTCLFRPGRDSDATRTRIKEAVVAAINDVTSQSGATLYRDVIGAAVHGVADPLGLLSCRVKLALQGNGSPSDKDLPPADPSVVLTTNAGVVTVS
jgi:hypothetical protein